MEVIPAKPCSSCKAVLSRLWQTEAPSPQSKMMAPLSRGATRAVEATLGPGRIASEQDLALRAAVASFSRVDSIFFDARKVRFAVCSFFVLCASGVRDSRGYSD